MIINERCVQDSDYNDTIYVKTTSTFVTIYSGVKQDTENNVFTGEKVLTNRLES